MTRFLKFYVNNYASALILRLNSSNSLNANGQKITCQLDSEPHTASTGFLCNKENSSSAFIKKVKLNGLELKGTRISYKQIMKDGKLEFYLSDKHQ